MIIDYKPFPAVRINGKKGRFTPRAIKYHNDMNNLRLLIGKNKEQIQKDLIDGYYLLHFLIEMPKSWSEKKKAEMIGTPHQQKPDIDNLFKAFTDTIFYKSEINDSKIWDLGAKKFWGEKSCIEFKK